MEAVLLRLPRMLCQIFSWMFDSDGSVSAAFKAEVQIIPVGMVLWRPSTLVPTGWILCDGQEISRTDFPALFEVIGTLFGAGNGTTTYNVPDLQNRFLMGKSSTRAVGDNGGESEHTLLAAELPSLQPTLYAGGLPLRTGSTGVGTIAFAQGNEGASTQDVTINALGNDLPHNNLPPFIVGSFLIKA